jgi:hypothetical protein
MTRPTLQVVVEGKTDALILRAILRKEVTERLRFFAGQGQLSLATLGRNLLVHEGGPVLIVMNSDTLNQQLADELQSMTRLAVSGVAQGGSCQVLTFVPTIEVISFEAPQALARLLGKAVSAEKVKEGLLVPKETLMELLGDEKPKVDYLAFVQSIDTQSARILASGKQARELEQTIESMLALANVASTPVSSS